MKVEKRELKCKFSNEWNGMKVVSMPIRSLWTSVREVEKYQKLLLEDIPEQGLTFPILVVDATFAETRKQKMRYGASMKDVPLGFEDQDKIFVVWGGTQRVIAAQKLGYTHIDCVIYDNDFASAFKDQNLHRKEYNHWYHAVPQRVKPS